MLYKLDNTLRNESPVVNVCVEGAMYLLELNRILTEIRGAGVGSLIESIH